MNINLPSSLVVCGKPKSGKSHFIKWFMFHYSNKFSYGVVFNKTQFTQSYDYIPEKFIHSNYKESIVQNLMKIQANIIQSGKTPNEAFIIFDDCLGSDQFTSQLFIDLTTQYRHYHITLIIATQYIYKVPPLIRECAQYAVIFRQTTERSNNAIHETFGEMFSVKQDDFSHFLKENTKDHQFVLFDAYDDSDDSKDAYKVMQAPEKLPDLQIVFKTSYN